MHILKRDHTKQQQQQQQQFQEYASKRKALPINSQAVSTDQAWCTEHTEHQLVLLTPQQRSRCGGRMKACPAQSLLCLQPTPLQHIGNTTKKGNQVRQACRHTGFSCQAQHCHRHGFQVSSLPWLTPLTPLTPLKRPDPGVTGDIKYDLGF